MSNEARILPIEQFHFRLSSRKERDIAISLWIAENRDYLNVSEHIKDAFYWWIQARAGQAIPSFWAAAPALEEIEPTDQLAQNLLAANEW
jgi:hypothetical protein